MREKTVGPGLQQALVPESSGRSKEGWVVKAGDPGPTALSADMPSGRPRDHLQTPHADWDEGCFDHKQGNLLQVPQVIGAYDKAPLISGDPKHRGGSKDKSQGKSAGSDSALGSQHREEGVD